MFRGKTTIENIREFKLLNTILQIILKNEHRIEGRMSCRMKNIQARIKVRSNSRMDEN